MAGFRGKVTLAVLLLLGTTSSAQAWWGWGWGWRSWGWHRYYPSYYYAPAYAYSYPQYAYPSYASYPAPAACSTPMPLAAAPQAQPVMQKAFDTAPGGPAPGGPGGQSKEPPTMGGDLLKKAPTIIESRSLGGSYAQGSTKERCKVGFWNLTGRDVTLKVDGQLRMLAKDRAVTLELDRAFVWQIDQRDSVSERVPEEQPFHEVILRQ